MYEGHKSRAIGISESMCIRMNSDEGVTRETMDGRKVGIGKMLGIPRLGNRIFPS